MAIASIFPTIKPALSLDFANTKQLDQRITFSRATSGTYFDSKGVMQTAAAGVARFDHDPLTLESLGLLIEESRYNAFLNSATPVTQSISVTAIPYTLSFYGSGQIVMSGAYVATIDSSGGAADRAKITFTPSAGTLTLTVTGSPVNCQLEAGSFATSYIPTGASQVTRAADAASMTGTNFSSWYRQDEGWFLMDVSADGSGNTGRVQIDDGTASNRLIVAANVGVASEQFVIVGGTNQAVLNVGTFASPLSIKSALAYKVNDFSGVANGGSAVSDSSGSVPVVTTMRIGANQSATYGSARYKRLAYYPKRLTNAQLQALTV